jgi:hypothetical protein
MMVNRVVLMMPAPVMVALVVTHPETAGGCGGKAQDAQGQQTSPDGFAENIRGRPFCFDV